MDNFSITQDGKPLDVSLYTIDIKNKIFASKAVNLELDFTGGYGWTFKTYGYCTFKTDSRCTFRTGCDCTFKTGNHCTFDTGDNCTFQTASSCTFDTGSECTFNIWDRNSCKFKKYDGISTILDRNDKKHYLLTKELVSLQKVVNG